MIESIVKKEEKIKRLDVKIDPTVKDALQEEALRLKVFDYEIAEEAIRCHLAATATLPKHHGSAALPLDLNSVRDALPVLFSDPSASEIAGIITRTVSEWKSRKNQPAKTAVADIPEIPKGKTAGRRR